MLNTSLAQPTWSRLSESEALGSHSRMRCTLPDLTSARVNHWGRRRSSLMWWQLAGFLTGVVCDVRFAWHFHVTVHCLIMLLLIFFFFKSKLTFQMVFEASAPISVTTAVLHTLMLIVSSTISAAKAGACLRGRKNKTEHAHTEHKLMFSIYYHM